MELVFNWFVADFYSYRLLSESIKLICAFRQNLSVFKKYKKMARVFKGDYLKTHILKNNLGVNNNE